MIFHGQIDFLKFLIFEVLTNSRNKCIFCQIISFECFSLRSIIQIFLICETKTFVQVNVQPLILSELILK